MEIDFWHERWREGRIGFHQPETNRMLLRHWERLAGAAGAGTDIFVPLCGKSLDMVWLAGAQNEADAARGRSIIGVDVSPIAIRQFFEERGAGNNVTIETSGAFEIHRWSCWELWCGDFFAFPPARLANTELAYDRASLIALPASMRERYARQLAAVLPPRARTLLITLGYDQSEMDGPPFSVPVEKVLALFTPHRHVEHIETKDTLSEDARMRERGLSRLETHVFVIGAAHSA